MLGYADKFCFSNIYLIIKKKIVNGVHWNQNGIHIFHADDSGDVRRIQSRVIHAGKLTHTYQTRFSILVQLSKGVVNL